MSTSIPQKISHRKLYQTLMTWAYALDSGHRYYYILRFIVYFYFIDWFVMVVLAPAYIMIEKKDKDISFIMELIQYITAGILYSLVFLVIILKKESIESNYNCIQTHFNQWSKKRGMDPDIAYWKSSQTIKSSVMPFIITTSFISFGPLLSAINDYGKMPLDSQQHFVLFWPKFIEMNTFSIYGIIFSIQFVFVTMLYISVASFNFGCMVFINEMNSQYEMLIDGIKDAFDYRMNDDFKSHFNDCIHHHQIIIRFLDDFKSYFRWILLIEVIMIQGILAILVFNLTRTEASLGYKIKIIGGLIFNTFPYYFHCQMGENILSLHRRLADHMYHMMWYEMPNKHKQLIVIMYQRTQRDLSLNSALFSSDKASRLLISRMVKQVYTLTNLLLKT